ncbi:MAG: hypothetical protein E7316_01790 [Clostridiales bacterium]|nr:hypothetical protein [Clostridiales bacterium]
MKRFIASLLLAAMCFTLTSCQQLIPGKEAPTQPQVTATPEPALSCDPSTLYSAVDTQERIVSLVLEGYTDDTSLTQLVDLLTARGIPCVWFVSGVTATEHTQMVRYAAQSGMELGNYTISAEKNIGDRGPTYLVHQFERTQRLIAEASLQFPSVARCNQTTYTEPMLQAIRAAGLTHAVEPTLYLNHRSFATESDAQQYMDSIIRGSIISIKLGQELDADEYGDMGEVLDERPAIDPPPTISEDSSQDSAEWTYQNIVPVVTWLLDQLEANDYRVVSLEEIKASQSVILPRQREMSEAELALYDPANYDLPATDGPIGQPAVRAGDLSDLNGAVFIGDSVTTGLAGYVDMRRAEDPTFLPDTAFISWTGFSVESALASVDIDATLTDLQPNVAKAVKDAGANRVYLMAKFDTSKAYVLDQYLANLRLLIFQIRQENPGVPVIVQSVLPGLSRRTSSPSNEQIFRYNLLLARMCQEYGIPFVDAAHALRDENGGLKAEYCIDRSTYGLHLSDAGCEAWLDYLAANIPD